MDQERDYQGSEKRRTRRSRVLLSAKVTTARGELDVRLRNLSQYGALLLCDTPPPLRSEVTFERGEIRASAHVIWTDGARFGIEFHEPIDEHELLVHLAPAEHYEPPPQFKPPSANERSGFHSHSMTPAERRIAEGWFNPDGRNQD